jgi:predicted anti-sigma-YlaC factor YlaD
VNSRLGEPNQPEPEGDPFAEYDAAYVFGALASDDRAAFERHLQNCAACSAAVAAMAGVPGLLSRVPLDRVIGAEDDAPLPDTLLPRLVAEVARQRTRSRWRVGAAAALAAACVLGLLIALLVNQRTDRTTAGGRPGPATTGSATGPGQSSTASTAPVAPAGPELTMTPVGQVGLSASVQLQSVLWGTRITLKCHEATTVGTPPYAGMYHLVVIGRDHSRRPVAEWMALAGKTVHIDGSTGLVRADIASLQLVDADRDVVLNLRL